MDDEEEEIISTVLASPGGNTITKMRALIGAFKFEDDQDTKDLFIKVDDPMKHVGKIESFVSYRVTTKTTRSSFDNPEYAVRRRYQDFLWLRQKLAEMHPTHLVPPLPEKHSMRLDRSSNEFLATRQRALNKFLERISEHPVLSFNENLKVFLTAKAWELTAHRRQSSSLVSRMGSSLRTSTTAALLRNRSPEYTVMGEYVHMLGEKLGSIDRISQRILNESKEYVGELKTYSPAFRLWGNSESTLSGPLGNIADAVESCSKSVEEMNTFQETEFTPLVKEYILYAESIKSVLKKRDQFQMEHELAMEELNKKKNEREQLQREVEVLSDRTECANADLKADMERWHHNRQKDLKEALRGMAHTQIMCHTGILQAWEEVINNLRDEAGFLRGEDPSPMHPASPSDATSAPTLTTPTDPAPGESRNEVGSIGGSARGKPLEFPDITNGLADDDKGEEEDDEEEINAS
ncbi:sorting nexin-7-like [Diadema setosum]|uniref:sorting nexin-7-like n=1 Tax=Diadema setosum TaxID=31175 RepID=UPI003B3BA343